MSHLSAAEAVALAADALAAGPPAVGVTLIAGGARPPGERMMVWADRYRGSLGDAGLDEAVVARARDALEAARPAVVEIVAGSLTGSVYLEPHRPPPALVIVGAGHIARPLCRVGAMLGFRVTVIDDRPDFATRERFPEAETVLRADFTDPFRDVAVGTDTHLVLVTRGHKYDFEALRDLLGRPTAPAYIGMVGSRRRVRAALVQLSAEGISSERLKTVHAPIGIDICAETPEEIAVAIAAELILIRRGGNATSLRDRERVVDRWLEKTAGQDFQDLQD